MWQKRIPQANDFHGEFVRPNVRVSRKGRQISATDTGQKASGVREEPESRSSSSYSCSDLALGNISTEWADRGSRQRSMTSNVRTHSQLWDLHASSMTVDLASSRMGRLWLKIAVDDIKRYNPRLTMGPACFQHDRGFGFQPNEPIAAQDRGR
jgi:hypothetical protein